MRPSESTCFKPQASSSLRTGTRRGIAAITLALSHWTDGISGHATASGSRVQTEGCSIRRSSNDKRTKKRGRRRQASSLTNVMQNEITHVLRGAVSSTKVHALEQSIVIACKQGRQSMTKSWYQSLVVTQSILILPFYFTLFYT